LSLETLLLSRSTKKYRRGTDRIVAPAETVTKARRVMASMGITRVATVTGLDFIGIPVVMACRPNSRSLAVSQGKGLDLDSARASALMESIELYHAERIAQPLRLATLTELQGELAVVDVARLSRLSISSFHANLKLLWIEGYDLMKGRPTWLPYEMVHANYTLPLPTGSGCFVMSSNGLASGNSVVEAIVHGLTEVIERDATTLWTMQTLAQQDARRVELSTVDDLDCRRALDSYRNAEVAVGVWETTTDVGIPAFMCIIIDRRRDPLQTLYPNHGMGCHLVREIALLRALTEAAQSRLTFIAGSRDDRGRDAYRQASEQALATRIRERLEAPGGHSFRRVPTHVHDTFEEDVERLLTGLRAVGIEEVVVSDLSKPEIGIPVVRVVVPGLEPLFEVPGYLPGPRAQAAIAGREGAAP
jgi:YcaO-like protein with predicted kinase domain